MTWATIGTALVGAIGIIVAGVVGPKIAATATRDSDQRRFEHERGLKAKDFDHERKLKASDDFVARIDDVVRSFEDLTKACALMRMTAVFLGPEHVETLKAVQAAEAAHLLTTEFKTRLAMRPHSDPALNDSASAAASSMYRAIENVRNANLRRQAAEKAAGQEIVLGGFNDSYVEEQANLGVGHMQEFQAQARVAIGRLLS